MITSRQGLGWQLAATCAVLAALVVATLGGVGGADVPACGPGFYSAGTVCIVCPVGTFNATAGASACTNCAPGSFNATAGASACTNCPLGRFSATEGASACTNCAPGSFNATAGASACTDCPLGQFSDVSAATACLDCATGTFQSATGQSSCTSCPTGQYAFTEASTTCVSCEPWTGNRSVRLTKINTDPLAGNDGLTISTQFVVSSGFASLDPSVTGAHVIVETAGNEFVLDAVLAPGLYLGPGTRGWEERKMGAEWVYRDTTDNPIGGIASMTIADASRREPGQVQVKVTGKNATYVVQPGDEPLRVVINLDDASSPQCGDSDFVLNSCAFDKKERTLTCRIKS